MFRTAAAVLALAVPAEISAEYVAFRAVGAVDAAGFATQVHCAHFGSGSTTFKVRFFDPNGTLDCEIEQTMGDKNTRTFATRDVSIFDEDILCSAPPGIAAGRIDVVLTDGSSRRVACTVNVLSTLATPAFVDTLPLYNHAWIPLARVIFENGFEGGDLTDWSFSLAS